MKKKILITLCILAGLIFRGYFLIQQMKHEPLPPKAPPIEIKVGHFKILQGWQHANHDKSLQTFQISCRTMIRRPQNANAGSPIIPLTAQDWLAACHAALNLGEHPKKNQARRFFEKFFSPVTFHQNKPVSGLFTGYYMPYLQASLVKTSEYHIPIYGVPDDLVSFNPSQFAPGLPERRYFGRVRNHEMIPYFTRKEINQGAISKNAPVLVWVNSAMDRLDLEIQGSGVAQLPNGEKIYLGYAGENGAPYTAIARVLIDKNIMNRDTASMQAIRSYFIKHPQIEDKIINKNKSFVFFKILKQKIALGAQGVGLTPGYSLAIDRRFIPLGTPVWLTTTHPGKKNQKQHPLQRLMIAQDTGGAIKGMVRGDVYWGAGEKAFFVAGRMRNDGQYWLLLPKHALKNLPKLID